MGTYYTNRRAKVYKSVGFESPLTSTLSPLDTNRASKVHYCPPSFRFPPLREGNRERRARSVPPACRGNLKEGVLVYPYLCELWFNDWYEGGKGREWGEFYTHRNL
jgi:hypothetical protein